MPWVFSFDIFLLTLFAFVILFFVLKLWPSKNSLSAKASFSSNFLSSSLFFSFSASAANSHLFLASVTVSPEAFWIEWHMVEVSFSIQRLKARKSDTFEISWLVGLFWRGWYLDTLEFDSSWCFRTSLSNDLERYVPIMMFEFILVEKCCY